MIFLSFIFPRGWGSSAGRDPHGVVFGWFCLVWHLRFSNSKDLFLSVSWNHQTHSLWLGKQKCPMSLGLAFARQLTYLQWARNWEMRLITKSVWSARFLPVQAPWQAKSSLRVCFNALGVQAKRVSCRILPSGVKGASSQVVGFSLARETWYSTALFKSPF